MGRKKEVWTPLEILGHINFENARAYRDIVPIQALWPSLRSKLIKSGVTDHGNAPSNWWQFAWSKVERPYSAVEDFSAVDLLDDFDIADANESDRPGDVEREATAISLRRGWAGGHVSPIVPSPASAALARKAAPDFRTLLGGGPTAFAECLCTLML